MTHRPIATTLLPRGRPSFAIDSSSTHRDAPQSAAFVLCDLHCKALPVERIPADAVASRRGARRRAGWEGSKGKKGSLALDRLLHPAQVAPHPSFVLPARSAFTYIFEASSCPPPPPAPSTLNSVLRFLFTLYAPVRAASADHRDGSREFLGLHFLPACRSCSLFTFAHVYIVHQ